jgi:hypothetical protein
MGRYWGGKKNISRYGGKQVGGMGCARFKGDLQGISRSEWNQDAQWVVK